MRPGVPVGGRGMAARDGAVTSAAFSWVDLTEEDVNAMSASGRDVTA
jgi:hypothetical protein